jgi:transcriptional regulator with XRE-family HTH domain
MSESIGPNVGPRIRAIREQMGLSLRALAARSNLSANAISLIERGENSPTVSSLHLLATALGVRITDFFEEAREQSVVFLKPKQRLRTQTSGFVMESMGIGLPNQQMEPFLMTVAPGTENMNEPIVHPGQEFVCCLEGAIDYVVGDQSYRLLAGDSLLFEATQPHRFWAVGESPAKVLVVFQAAVERDLARQRHLET